MENLSLKQLTSLVLEQAKEKGFGTKPEDINVGEKIALVHSEAVCPQKTHIVSLPRAPRSGQFGGHA